MKTKLDTGTIMYVIKHLNQMIHNLNYMLEDDSVDCRAHLEGIIVGYEDLNKFLQRYIECELNAFESQTGE
jgi:hypothetical protein